jgi:hypothetical protein
MPVARIPLSALRVPDGKVAVTLSIHGLDAMSLVVDVGKVETIVADVDASVRAIGGSRTSEKSHVLVRRAVDLAMREGDELGKQGAMLSVLWLALNHPHHAEQVRAGMSQALRERGRVHLSVTVDARQTWAFSLADRWVDMTSVLEAIPEDQHISLAYGEPSREKSLQ